MPSCGKRWVKLSPREDELLRALVQHAGKVRTHRFLLKELWDEPTDAQYLRVYVRQLRKKIETDPERPQFVLTEIGIGYRLRKQDQVIILRRQVSGVSKHEWHVGASWFERAKGASSA